MRWFSPTPWNRADWKLQYKGEVIAITLTPVRHKRHMQFLTSAPNFRGSADPWPGLSDPLPYKCSYLLTREHMWTCCWIPEFCTFPWHPVNPISTLLPPQPSRHTSAAVRYIAAPTPVQHDHINAHQRSSQKVITEFNKWETFDGQSVVMSTELQRWGKIHFWVNENYPLKFNLQGSLLKTWTCMQPTRQKLVKKLRSVWLTTS